MVEAREPTNTADWRHRESYRYTFGLPRRGWAWEFLRRNPDYRHDAAALSQAASIDTRDAGLTLLTAGAARRALARWGVLFRRYTREGRGRRHRLLGPGDLPACAAAHRGPARRRR